MILNLKGRLKLIADKVPECNVLADIGTDHAYIPIYLVQNGVCQKAIASDIKIGPVKMASNNISLYKLSEKIETRLGNGLDTIEINEADSIIIAGMGGTLVTELLEANKPKTVNTNALVLQPMNDLHVVRKWLYDNAFEIYDEEMVAEGPKLYCVLSAKFSGKKKDYSDFELHVGQSLIEKKDPLLSTYCRMKVKQIDRVLEQLEDMKENDVLKTQYARQKIDYINLIEKL
ncbi:tRNA (adenine(22)-N(1))-methyltransferase [Ruminiclostridium papyrosolvens]|uniref:SAM-dependent methyltransferase n=1 Tax=Ruminiclostridium papyrosolvens C7 TaxID=1330534 RepID=U4R5M1_9FIRM|nr:class I SAM-dependent methyltransferase [Ruminiclostridium papyrosolvens]EPR13966.1 SAM-dependent methyltransferase [Ruminiclostridium papyrosolvens C7]